MVFFRRKWAINAIEEEKNDRLSANFLTNLTSTNWFHEAISSQHNKDYDVVCPYYKLGCRVTCKKSDIENHVKSCPFAVESSQISNSEVLDENYEVVCPNSILGCTYTGGRKALQQHLEEGCAHTGKTRQEELEERHLVRHQVIHDCEEERVRRLTEDKQTVSRSSKSSSHRGIVSGTPSSPSSSPDHTSLGDAVLESTVSSVSVQDDNDCCPPPPVESDAGDHQILTLHLLMEQQMNYVVTGLHNEALQFWEQWQNTQNERRPLEVNLIQQLQNCMRKLWNFASLEPFGSWATGLPGVRSDIDLVVCFEDDILLTKTPTSRHDLLRKLARYLEKHAQSLITITKVLLHTRVPLIKASARISVPCPLAQSGTRAVMIELDISIDGPEHSGLATTSLSQAMLKALPGLGPATMLIKEYLKEKGLCDSFTGGLASYGIFLLVSLLFLRRYHANQLSVEERQLTDTDDQECVVDNRECETTAKKNASVTENSTTPVFAATSVKTSNKTRGQGLGQAQRTRTLDKSFSSEYVFSDSSSSPPPPPPGHITENKGTGASQQSPGGSVTTAPSIPPPPPPLTRSSSDPSPYSFINVKQQKEYGRRVAAMLLLNPDDYDDKVSNVLSLQQQALLYLWCCHTEALSTEPMFVSH